MKKTLILSLCLNIAFVVVGAIWLLWPSPITPAPASSIEPLSSVSTPLPEAELVEIERGAEVAPVARTSLPELGALTPEEQVAALVEAGWSREDAKVFALGQVMREGMRLMLEGRGIQGEEYWKQAMGPDMDWESQRKMVEMQHRMQEVMEDLFGMQVPGMFGTANIPLPREKIRAAALIQQDYQMMQMKLQRDTGGVMLPEDHKALALLEEERARDLAAILSSDELFEYEVRASHTAMSLRNRISGMEPTEEEFREIFRLQQEVDRVGGARLQGGDEETMRQHTEATEKMKLELRETLGEERYRQYERNQDWSYGRLVGVVKRLDLPRERVDEVYDLKEYTENQQRELQNQQDLSGEERQAALQTLSKETREDLKELLGEGGLELYQQNGGHWLHQLPR